jgi:hypothetical protein
MEYMKKLWEHRVRVWDEYKHEKFTLKAIIFATTNDYPALFSPIKTDKKEGKLVSFAWMNNIWLP